jgi:hypothetical protein
MDKTDSELMAEYGITSKTKTLYSYKQHNYEHLKDALSYAKIDSNRHQKDGLRVSTVNDAGSSKRLGG